MAKKRAGDAGPLILVVVMAAVLVGAAGWRAGLFDRDGTLAPAPMLPSVLEKREQPFNGGTALVISARGPADASSAQALVDTHRAGHALVRLFFYNDGARPGKDRPLALYEWTMAGGLTRKY